MSANFTKVKSLENIPNQYKLIFSGDNFSLHDAKDDDESNFGRIFIFAITENFGFLS